MNGGKRMNAMSYLLAVIALLVFGAFLFALLGRKSFEPAYLALSLMLLLAAFFVGRR